MGRDYSYAVCQATVVKDAEMQYLPSGMALTKLRVAIGDDYFDKKTNEWVNRSDFFNFTFWGDAAQRVGEQGLVGSKVLIEYRPKNNNYEKDGKTVYRDDFVGNGFRVLAKSKSAGDSGEPSAPREQAPKAPLSDDAPF